ncbi:iron complex outermembrane receptor protein [Duganella sp. 3397]|uniref:TonB-dependent receptor n=1 Tax=Duganella sp. 3397 TaxID=2817732 RepID=UPI0028640578|nr:TonB-dependent receptor [Duganella sp. 3397]MDR7049564.1 iron complex outermembrane receptor protein [Duganella sp. 3397]
MKSTFSAPNPRAFAVLVAAALTAWAPAAQAQAQAQDASDANTVIVAASRSNIAANQAPQTVVIIKQEDIEQQLAISGNSSDVLSSILPSYTPSRGKMNGSGETLRGRTPLILVDGVPQSNPMRPTGREAHTIDFSMVERIEIVQGANAINGLGATGGTINIITKRPQKGTVNQSFEVQTTLPTTDVGSDTASYKTSYNVSGRNDKFEYLFGLSYEDQGLYLDGRGRSIGADTTQGDLMDSRSYDALVKLGYWFDDNQRLQLSVNRYKIKSKANYQVVAGDRALGIPSTSVKITPEGTPPWNDVWTSSLSYRHANLAGMELTAMIFNQEFEGLFGADISATFQDPLIAPTGTLYDQSRSVASKYGSKVGLGRDDLLNGRLKLTVGFDTLFDKGKQDLYLTGRTYVPNSEYRNYSLFAQGEYKLLDNLTMHAGARKEKADLTVDTYRTLAQYRRVLVQGGKLDFSEELYNAGLVWNPAAGLTLFTSYSEGFGMPDIGRVLRSINTPGQSVANMRDLAPILTRNVELGGRYHKGAWDLDAAYFRANSDFGTRVIAVNGAFMMAREKTRTEGLDLGAAYRINAAHRAKVSYAYTKGRYDTNADGSLDGKLDGLNVAPNRVIATWNADWNDRWSTFVQAQHAFSQSFDEAAKEFSGYSLVDATTSYKLGKGNGELRLSVANLFDKDYITYYSQSALIEPKRYFAGRGRTLSLGYALRF